MPLIIDDPILSTVAEDAALALVLPRAKGLADIAAAAMIRSALRELCQRSLIWREHQTAVSTQIGVQDYAFGIGQDREIVRLLGVSVGGCGVTLVDPQQGASLDECSPTCTYAYGGLSGFRISPAPSEDGIDIVTFAAVMPAIGASGVPAAFTAYVECIAGGALARLKADPGKSYSDPAGALLMAQEWERDIGRVIGDAFRGGARVAPRVVGRFF